MTAEAGSPPIGWFVHGNALGRWVAMLCVSTGEVHEIGCAVGYRDHPAYLVELPGGDQRSWPAHSMRLATPEERARAVAGAALRRDVIKRLTDERDATLAVLGEVLAVLAGDPVPDERGRVHPPISVWVLDHWRGVLTQLRAGVVPGDDQLLAARHDSAVAAATGRGSDEFGSWGDGDGVRLAREYIARHGEHRLRLVDLVRAEHVSGVRMKAGPSFPLMSPGAPPPTAVPDQEATAALARLREQLDATPFGCAVQLSHRTAETIVQGAVAAGGGAEPVPRSSYDEVVGIATARGNERDELTRRGDELAAAMTQALGSGDPADWVRAERAVRAWEEAR